MAGKHETDYLRPHLQHGLLIRAINSRGELCQDMRRLICGIIRIDLPDALRWLGDPEIFRPENMMPGPMFDAGLSELIDTSGQLSATTRICFR